MMLRKRYLLLATSVAFGACTKTSRPVPSLVSDPTAFSTRGAPADGVIEIIQLKTPSLIESAESIEGKIVISKKAKNAILKEQEETERELLARMPNARVLFRYRMNFNGLAIMISKSESAKIASLRNLKAVHKSLYIPQPEVFQKMESQKNLETVLVEASSTGWIGAIKLNEQGITGKGIKIGIVDTGIDYTHKMFGGSGNPSDYKNNDSTLIEPGSFPTAKVQGGIDLSGDKWLRQGDLEIPQPDLDPLDARDHGTHVAGTAAGVGDGIHTYNGVAPDAALIAIKVFAKAGDTTEEIVMAALDYAVDPDGDLDPGDRLDVLNLSFGSPFEMPIDRPYPIALKMLEKAGVAVVLSAGNRSNVPFIVSSPSSLYEGQLSVAASVDNDPVNWQFSASSAVLKGETRFIESKWAPTCDAPDTFLGVSGDLVYIGLADKDLPPEMEAALSGKIALIDRGGVTFQEKLARALKAKAKGVVVVYTKVKEPTSTVILDVAKDFPIVLISLENGQAIKEAMKSSVVSFTFTNEKKLEKPELIDQIAGFSSRGPRLGDGLIKPQISAPGTKILSAAAGSGSEGIRKSGTSMAAPHMAGVMALMKQALPNASVSELNTRLMNSSKILTGKSGYEDIARQGAGRVQVDLAVDSEVLLTPNALSLGFVEKDAARSLSKKLVVENRSQEDRVFAISTVSKELIKVKTINSLLVPARSKAEFTVEFEYLGKESSEVDGFIILSDVAGQKMASVPFLGIIRDDLELSVRYNPLRRETTVTNRSGSDIEVLKDFKLLGTSSISKQKLDVSTKNPCDLRSAAARILGQDDKKTLQIAYSVQTKHEINARCEPSVQLDLNSDGKPDIEVVLSTDLSTLVNDPSLEHAAGTALIDFSKAQDIAIFNQAEAKKEKPELKPFTEAILDLTPQKLYKMSTVQVLNIQLKALSKALDKDLPSSIGVKIAMQSFGDEFLNGDKWQTLDLTQLSVTMEATETLKNGATLSLKKTPHSDVIYVPGSKVEQGLFVGGGVETILLK